MGGSEVSRRVALRPSSQLLICCAVIVHLAIATVWLLSSDPPFAAFFLVLASLSAVNLRCRVEICDEGVRVRNPFRSYTIESSAIKGIEAANRFHFGVTLIPWPHQARRRDWYLVLSDSRMQQVAVFSEFRGLLDDKWKPIGTAPMAGWFGARTSQRPEA